MNQAQLAPASQDPKGKDPFARVRAEYPGHKFILIFDRRPSSPIDRIMLAVPASSAWYALLPDDQLRHIDDLDPATAHPEVLLEYQRPRAGVLPVREPNPDFVLPR